MSTRHAFLRVGLLMVWVMAVAALAAIIADAQHDSRAEMRARFADRAEVAASFVGTYAQQLTASQSVVARRHLTRRRVRPQAFAGAVSRTGMGAALLLDRGGRALHVAPPNAAVLGRDLGRRCCGEHGSGLLNPNPGGSG